MAVLAIFAATASQAAGSKTAPARPPGASSLFPKIGGWRLSDGPTTYSPETLFEYIDGGAESFLQFDFQDLASATYVTTKFTTERIANRRALHRRPSMWTSIATGTRCGLSGCTRKSARPAPRRCRSASRAMAGGTISNSWSVPPT